MVEDVSLFLLLRSTSTLCTRVGKGKTKTKGKSDSAKGKGSTEVQGILECYSSERPAFPAPLGLPGPPQLVGSSRALGWQLRDSRTLSVQGVQTRELLYHPGTPGPGTTWNTSCERGLRCQRPTRPARAPRPTRPAQALRPSGLATRSRDLGRLEVALNLLILVVAQKLVAKWY